MSPHVKFFVRGIGLLALGWAAGCSSDEGADANASTGGSAELGGATGASGSASGGSPAAGTGGTTATTGGAMQSTGGVAMTSGGTMMSGGTTPSGGSPTAGGGTTSSTGGGTSGGADSSTGGASGGSATGGGGASSTGGSTGGVISDGGGPPGGGSGGQVAAADTWDSYAQGFFEMYCVSCHNDDNMGDAARDQHELEVVVDEKDKIACGLSKSMDDWSARGCSGSPQERQFPVGSGPKPSDEERDRLIGWIDAGTP